MLVASLVSGRLITGAAECWDSVGDTSFVRLVHIHVRRRADAYAGLSELCTGSHQLGDSEIQLLWSTVEIEHDVAWFDVPVNQLAGVGVVERCGNAFDDGDRCRRRLPAGGTQQLLECSAFEELHDPVTMPIADPKIVNLHDVRVPQAGHTRTSAKNLRIDRRVSASDLVASTGNERIVQEDRVRCRLKTRAARARSATGSDVR